MATQQVAGEKVYYTVSELMERWGVSRMTIYREIRRGRLRRKHIGGSVRFSVVDVADYEKKAG